MNTLPAELLQRIDAANLAGVRTFRAMMRRSIGLRDREAPQMREVRDFLIPGPAGELEARFYRPHGAARGGPALVFFHGGGFVIGDLDTNDAFVRRLAAAGRVAIVAVQYRLAPEARWPAPMDDALAATRWIIAHAADFGIAADRLGLSGDSAGAYLAVAVTAELNRAASGTVAAQVLIYPLMHVDDAAWKTTVLRDSRILGRAAVAYIRAALAVPAGIPALHAADLPPAPPTLIATGGQMDPIRPDARAYAEALRAAGASVVTREYAALPHGFGSASHLFPASRAALAEIGQLAGQLLRGEA